MMCTAGLGALAVLSDELLLSILAFLPPKSAPWGSSFVPPQKILHGEECDDKETSCQKSHVLAPSYVYRVPVCSDRYFFFQMNVDRKMCCAGYTHEIKGDTAEKRLDIRCSTKGDKFCR